MSPDDDAPPVTRDPGRGPEPAPAPAPGPRPGPADPGRPARRRTFVAAGVALLLVIVATGIGVKLLADGTGTPPGGSGGALPGAEQTALGLPTVLAHRGGLEAAPLNTLAAVTASAEAGYGVETDVRWTDDDVAVLVHEPDGGEDLPCSPGHLIASTFYNKILADCHAEDAAGRTYPVATMRQAAEVVAKNPAAQLFAEIKTDLGATRTGEYLAILRETGIADRAVATSFQLDQLEALGTRADAEGIPLRRMLFLQKGPTASAADLAAAGLFAVALSPDLATTTFVTQLHGAGLKVIVWTVNTPKEWQQARDAGADTVLTDRPGAYLKWL